MSCRFHGCRGNDLWPVKFSSFGEPFPIVYKLILYSCVCWFRRQYLQVLCLLSLLHQTGKGCAWDSLAEHPYCHMWGPESSLSEEKTLPRNKICHKMDCRIKKTGCPVPWIICLVSIQYIWFHPRRHCVSSGEGACLHW